MLDCHIERTNGVARCAGGEPLYGLESLIVSLLIEVGIVCRCHLSKHFSDAAQRQINVFGSIS